MNSLAFKEDFDQKLKETLRRIQFSTQLTDGELCDILQLSKSDFERFWLGELELSLSNLASLSSQLSLSLDLIFSGKIDYRTLSRQRKSYLTEIPEKYLNPEHQIALKTSLLSAYDYMSQFHGKQYAESLLTRLQVDPRFLYTTGDFVSPLLQADFMNLILKEGFSTGIVHDIGSHSTKQFQSYLKQKDLRIPHRSHQLYELFFLNQLGASDLFFEYRIDRLEPNRCIFEIIQPPDKESILSPEIRNFSFSCQFKIGLIASLRTIIYRPKARFRKISCWFRGDSHCRFELDWDENSKVIPLSLSRL